MTNSVATIKKAQHLLIKIANKQTQATVLKRFGVTNKSVKPIPTGRSKFTHCYLKTTSNPDTSYRLLINKQSKDFVVEKIVDNTVVEKLVSNEQLR